MKISKYNVLSRLELEQYIIKNYKTFDWNKILILYIKDIKKYLKSTKIEKLLLFIEVLMMIIILKIYGIYNSNTLSSYTLDHKIAINYAAKIVV